MRTPRSVFSEQKSNAKQRGIKFHFSFEQWEAWWVRHLGPDWLQKRGCQKGQYVMARIKDAGDYHVDNVKCITHEGNSVDKVANRTTTFGERHKLAKLKERQVKAIKNSKDTVRVLMARYDVAKSTIRDIRVGRRWKHLP